MKKIYRSQENKIVFGIFGGIGEYFDIDPAIFRLVGLALCFATGIFPFILIYILAYFVIPNKDGEIKPFPRKKIILIIFLLLLIMLVSGLIYGLEF